MQTPPVHTAIFRDIEPLPIFEQHIYTEHPQTTPRAVLETTFEHSDIEATIIPSLLYCHTPNTHLFTITRLLAISDAAFSLEGADGTL
jgi:hypothetical protein